MSEGEYAVLEVVPRPRPKGETPVVGPQTEDPVRSIETSVTFPLSSVKPFESLQLYREYCIDATREALGAESWSREACPACESGSENIGAVDRLRYQRCSRCGTMFLREVADDSQWYDLLERVGERRNSASTFDSGVEHSRVENVYAPKKEWIESTLRLHGMKEANVVEVVSGQSPFTSLLEKGSFRKVASVTERALMAAAELTGSTLEDGRAAWDAAVLLESLDRSTDPAKILGEVALRVRTGGLIFVTALVASGFDIVCLGLRNMYLHPPDRTNCFSMEGLKQLLERTGYSPVEISTPGVLDVEIVNAHRGLDDVTLSSFEKQLLDSDQETREAFQTFLQQNRMSSFARIVARRSS